MGRLLITGAGGSLGTALAPMLVEAGHEPVLFDIERLQTRYRVVVGDVRQPRDVLKAMGGCDFVVHAAAIHGIHLGAHSPGDFYELNVTGTFNVWQAAVETGVKGVVFSSTMGVYGETGLPQGPDEIVILDEELPLLPSDIYGFTKVAGEELCRYYGREHGIPSISLRYGMFVPEPFFRHGVRLLYGGVDVSDAARAVMAAINALQRGRVASAAFNVESLVPFSAADGSHLRSDPLKALDHYYPGAEKLLRERGVERLAPIERYYPMRRIEQELGFRPEHNFDRWLAALARRPDERTDKNPPWP